MDFLTFFRSSYMMAKFLRDSVAAFFVFELHSRIAKFLFNLISAILLEQIIEEPKIESLYRLLSNFGCIELPFLPLEIMNALLSSASNSL